MTRRLEIGPIRLSSVDGPIVIAGWHDGTFGVDWRAAYHDLDGSPGGYVVSHLGSGYALVAVIANIEDVEVFIGRLHEVGDWSNATIDGCKVMIDTHREAIREVFDTVLHHDPKCFAMAPGLHGARQHGNA